MQVRLVGAHQAESRDTGFSSLLIDGVLALDAGSLASRLTLDEQRAIRWIVLSHYHYDHIKDLPVVCFNSVPFGGNFHHGKNVYAAPITIDRVRTYLMNGDSWPNFAERPVDRPAAVFHPIAAGHDYPIGDYTVRCVPSVHAVPTLAIQVSHHGRSVLYSGDAGPGSGLHWADLSPDHLITEVTMANVQTDMARRVHHFTPALLAEDLRIFRERRGYLPPVTVIHVNPIHEDDIRAEIAAVAADLGATIALGREDQILEIEEIAHP